MNLWRKYVTVTSVAACVSSTAPRISRISRARKERGTRNPRENRITYPNRRHTKYYPTRQCRPDQGSADRLRRSAAAPLEGKRAALRGWASSTMGKSGSRCPRPSVSSAAAWDRSRSRGAAGMAMSMARSLRSPPSSSRASASRRSRDSGLPALRTSASSRLISPPVSFTTTCSRDSWRVADRTRRGRRRRARPWSTRTDRACGAARPRCAPAIHAGRRACRHSRRRRPPGR